MERRCVDAYMLQPSWKELTFLKNHICGHNISIWRGALCPTFNFKQTCAFMTRIQTNRQICRRAFIPTHLNNINPANYRYWNSSEMLLIFDHFDNNSTNTCHLKLNQESHNVFISICQINVFTSIYKHVNCNSHHETPAPKKHGYD